MSDIARATRAKLLLEDDILKEAFDEVERRAINEAVASSDREKVYDFVAQVRAARNATQAIRAILHDWADKQASDERRRTVV